MRWSGGPLVTVWGSLGFGPVFRGAFLIFVVVLWLGGV